jgi:hypothetical protein
LHPSVSPFSENISKGIAVEPLCSNGAAYASVDKDWWLEASTLFDGIDRLDQPIRGIAPSPITKAENRERRFHDGESEQVEEDWLWTVLWLDWLSQTFGE